MQTPSMMKYGLKNLTFTWHIEVKRRKGITTNNILDESE